MAFAVLPTLTKSKRPADEPDPLKYSQARRSANGELWNSTEQEELHSLTNNKGRNIVSVPEAPDHYQPSGFTRRNDLEMVTSTK